MAVAFVKHITHDNGGSSSATCVATFASASAVGNAIVVGINWDGTSGGTITGISDGHNTYVRMAASSIGSATAGNFEWWVCRNNNYGGGALTVTVTQNASRAFLAIDCLEISGQDTGSDGDAGSGLAVSSATANADINGAALTSSGAGGMLFVGAQFASNSAGCTGASGYTTLNSGGGLNMTDAYKAVGAGSQTPQIHNGGTTQNCVISALIIKAPPAPAFDDGDHWFGTLGLDAFRGAARTAAALVAGALLSGAVARQPQDESPQAPSPLTVDEQSVAQRVPAPPVFLWSAAMFGADDFPGAAPVVAIDDDPPWPVPRVVPWPPPPWQQAIDDDWTPTAAPALGVDDDGWRAPTPTPVVNLVARFDHSDEIGIYVPLGVDDHPWRQPVAPVSLSFAPALRFDGDEWITTPSGPAIGAYAALKIPEGSGANPNVSASQTTTAGSLIWGWTAGWLADNTSIPSDSKANAWRYQSGPNVYFGPDFSNQLWRCVGSNRGSSYTVSFPASPGHATGEVSGGVIEVTGGGRLSNTYTLADGGAGPTYSYAATDITVDGPAILFGLWLGTGFTGDNTYRFTCTTSGWTLYDSLMSFGAGTGVQFSLFTKTVTVAGTYGFAGTSDTDPDASMYIIAVQQGTDIAEADRPQLPAPVVASLVSPLRFDDPALPPAAVEESDATTPRQWTIPAPALATVDGDVPAGALFGQADEDFDARGWTPPPVARRFAPLVLPDPEEIPAGVLRGQPDEDYDAQTWRPVPRPRSLAALILPDPEELPAGALAGQPDEDYDLRQLLPPPRAASFARLVLPDPDLEPAGALTGIADELLDLSLQLAKPAPLRFAPAQPFDVDQLPTIVAQQVEEEHGPRLSFAPVRYVVPLLPPGADGDPPLVAPDQIDEAYDPRRVLPPPVTRVLARLILPDPEELPPGVVGPADEDYFFQLPPRRWWGITAAFIGDDGVNLESEPMRCEVTVASAAVMRAEVSVDSAATMYCVITVD